MSHEFIGTLFGIDCFKSSSVPIGLVYPSGKKDGNRLGRRKSRLMHSGFEFLQTHSPPMRCILVHPCKVNDLSNLNIKDLNVSKTAFRL